MTLRHVSAPPAADVLALYGALTPAKPAAVRAAILQIARAEIHGFYLDAELAAAALLYPLPAERPGETLYELAFVCRPQLAGHLTALVHAAQSTRTALASNAPVRVRAHVRVGHRPGQRLARLLGMRPVGASGGFEVWECEVDHEPVRQGHPVAVQRSRYRRG